MYTLVSDSYANSKEYDWSPALDAATKIVFNEKDGTPSAYMAYNVKPMNFLDSEKPELSYSLKGVFDNWEVYVTDRRLVVRNPYIMGLFRAKQKNGYATAGAIPYKAMTNLSTFYNDQNVPVLLCMCLMDNGTKSGIGIESKDINLLKKIAADLYGRIDKWLITNDRKLVIDEKADVNMKEAVDKWNDFLNKSWSSYEEFNAFVPAKKFNKI